MRKPNGRSESSSKDILLAHAKQIRIAVERYELTNHIYRGILQTSGPTREILFVDPTRSMRQSANALNYYTLLIDNLPEWQPFPKRSRSLVCTTASYVASEYGGGTCYAVFPVGNPNIGICPSYDIWNSFRVVSMMFDHHDLAAFAREIGQIGMRMIRHSPDQDGWGRFLADLHEMNRVYIADPQKFSRYQAYFDNNDILYTLSVALDPKQNKFDVAPLSTADLDLNNQEVWLSAPCYLIRLDVLPRIWEELRNAAQ